MKIHFKNILFISIIISICLGLGFIVGNPIVINAITLIFIIHWISFIPANIYKTEKFFDLTGSITYISVILYVLYSKSKSFDSIIGEIIISASIIIWASRLGSFLFLRIKKAGEDKRFREFKKSSSRWLLTWTTSGMWVTICSLCGVTAISSDSVIEIGLLFYLGFFLFVSGFIIEIVADYQKTKFRSIPANKDKFISSGLWSKSRHPNYVGEITLWLGISIMSFSNLNGFELITLISPIFTYWLLVYVSGINILEKSGQKKWGHLESYKKYVKKTPQLFF
tara:strand:+ start:6683 stop:7525 length:843 start_codon:yes stop_codon:yes gene_type:complete